MSSFAQPILSAHNLHVRYRGGRPVLRGIDLVARAGMLAAVLGPNGSGKTTLLRTLLGQLHPSQGAVLLEGRRVEEYPAPERARRMAYVAQTPTVAFTYTVEEIVFMGRYARTGVLGLAREVDRQAVDAAIDATDVRHLVYRPLGQLSGGEVQRVMIARALAQQPAVLLLDEPTSNLDMLHQVKIYDTLRSLARNAKMAVITVSHDVNLAARFCDHLHLVRNGRLVASGTVGDTLRADVLQATFGVKIRMVQVPDSLTPVIIADSAE